MAAGGVFGGLIALALGVAGLMGIYGMIPWPIPLAPLVSFLGFTWTFLMFAAIAIVGLIVMAEAMGERPRKVVYAPAVAASGLAYETLTETDLAILRKASEKKSDGRIAKETGLSKAAVKEEIVSLQARGYLTRNHHLTDKGYAALHPPERRVVEERPPPAE